MTDTAANLIDRLAEKVYDNNETKGFWDHPSDPLIMVPLKIALIHSEASEALDVHRHAYDDEGEDSVIGMTPMQEEDFTEELADIVIRVLDLAGGYELDLGNAIIAKIEKNVGRPPKHGRRY
jgi:NTP pyrophosphatase (non-canonical NTP hydrolase)